MVCKTLVSCIPLTVYTETNRTNANPKNLFTHTDFQFQFIYLFVTIKA